MIDSTARFHTSYRFRKYFDGKINDLSINPIHISSTTPYEKTTREPPHDNRRETKKVTIVGVGHVGTSIICSLLNKGLGVRTLALISPNESKLLAQAKDFQQGSFFFVQPTKILASTEYDISTNSNLVIITAGIQPQKKRNGQLDKVVAIYQQIIPQVLKYSPHAPIMILSNPMDVMTAIAQKLAGPSFPAGQFFGTGTYLDCSRFKTIVGDSAGVDPKLVEGFIIGGHGPLSTPVWSSIFVGPEPMVPPGDEPDDTLQEIHQAVIHDGYDIVNGKEYTNWALALTVTRMTEMVLNNTKSIIPVSTCVRGLYGVENDVC